VSGTASNVPTDITFALCHASFLLFNALSENYILSIVLSSALRSRHARVPLSYDFHHHTITFALSRDTSLRISSNAMSTLSEGGTCFPIPSCTSAYFPLIEKRISSDETEVYPSNLAVQNDDMEKLPQWTKPEKPPTERSTRSEIVNTQFILLNTFSTVTIVFMNKM
jgi:hypothetical protein